MFHLKCVPNCFIFNNFGQRVSLCSCRTTKVNFGPFHLILLLSEFQINEIHYWWYTGVFVVPAKLQK
jgi:hypothetical protein